MLVRLVGMVVIARLQAAAQSRAERGDDQKSDDGSDIAPCAGRQRDMGRKYRRRGQKQTQGEGVEAGPGVEFGKREKDQADAQKNRNGSCQHETRPAQTPRLPFRVRWKKSVMKFFLCALMIVFCLTGNGAARAQTEMSGKMSGKMSGTPAAHPAQTTPMAVQTPDAAPAGAAGKDAAGKDNEKPKIAAPVERFVKAVTIYLARFVEMAAAIIIGIAAVRALWAYFISLRHSDTLGNQDAKDAIRLALGRSLALALEFELAADILNTAVAPTWSDIGLLAAIAVLRTALNYFLERELRAAEQRKAAAPGSLPVSPS